MSAPMNAASGHVDSFAREHPPPRSQWPGLLWTYAEFLAALPHTATGKIQRFKLRQRAAA